LQGPTRCTRIRCPRNYSLGRQVPGNCRCGPRLGGRRSSGSPRRGGCGVLDHGPRPTAAPAPGRSCSLASRPRLEEVRVMSPGQSTSSLSCPTARRAGCSPLL